MSQAGDGGGWEVPSQAAAAAAPQATDYTLVTKTGLPTSFVPKPAV